MTLAEAEQQLRGFIDAYAATTEDDARLNQAVDALLALRLATPTCSGCGAESCWRLWPQQRKCCPDCTCEPVPEQAKAEESDNG